jgi:hypothetical protein
VGLLAEISKDGFDRLLAESVNDSIRSLLGEKPSKTVFRHILRRLYSKLGLAFVEKANYGFLEYISELEMMENLVAPSQPITLYESDRDRSVKSVAIIQKESGR